MPDQQESNPGSEQKYEPGRVQKVVDSIQDSDGFGVFAHLLNWAFWLAIIFGIPIAIIVSVSD